MDIETVAFYDYFRSSASYRVRIALALKGLRPKRVESVDLRAGDQSAPAYKAVAPSGLTPSFDFGGKSFGQSLALIEWLDAKYPQPPLIPADADAALAAREIAHAIACDIHPLNNLRVLKYLTGPLGVSQEAKLAWYRHWIRAGFDTLETLIARHRDAGPYCLGAQVGLADVCLAPQVYNARRFEVDLSPYPAIRAVVDHCNGLPAFRQAFPEAV